jgi:MinD superfamily P-loop ATPase
MIRKIIRIDEEKCFGCGMCTPECQQAALQIVDGRGKLVEDWLCDGFGECLNACPGAISLEEREAEPYDESRVMANLVAQGKDAIQLHLRHLRKHNQTVCLQQAMTYLREHDIDMEAPVS